jgi:hypothetical protein
MRSASKYALGDEDTIVYAQASRTRRGAQECKDALRGKVCVWQSAGHPRGLESPSASLRTRWSALQALHLTTPSVRAQAPILRTLLSPHLTPLSAYTLATVLQIHYDSKSTGNGCLITGYIIEHKSIATFKEQRKGLLDCKVDYGKSLLRHHHLPV